MQRIVIKNFGAVKDVDIELKKITVLIGEQASGKSTIAKLVYYFKMLKSVFFEEIINENLEKENYISHFNSVCREKFYQLFGTTIDLPQFEIYYYFTDKKYIFLSSNENKILTVTFSLEIENRISSYLNPLKNQAPKNDAKSFYEDILIRKQQSEFMKHFIDFVNSLFESNQDDFLYVIAGRNATVSYSDLFEKYLFADVQYKVIENNKRSFNRRQYNVDEALMLEFIKRITRMKDYFKDYVNIENLITYYPKNESNLNIVLKKMNRIIKGRYWADKYGEKIIYNDKENDYVLLSNASSGQQEVIRILQDILISIAEESKLFRILEEPEAHLFPSAQKQLIELLSFLMNQNSDNQIIITTHSPYVLTVFNNLIFSKRITDKNPSAINDVNEIIQKEFWIDSEDFSAYNLGKADDTERKTQSIVNEKTGLIQQNYLDEVSEKLGNDFQKLYSIHQKSFSRR